MSEPTILPEHFINRELSWLDFNARVLEEAQDETNPLLERAKFLAIFSSNLDEFFMVRVAGLREQAFSAGAPQDPPADGISPIVQLQRIAFRTRQLVDQQYACWNQSIYPALAAEGIRLHKEVDLESSQVKQLDKFFRQRVFPVLTPMAIDPAHPSPRFHNRGLYLAATLVRNQGIGPEKLFAVVQLPQVLPRFVPLDPGGGSDFVLLEDVVASRLPELFGGYDLNKCGAFRMTRDMDIDLLDEEGDDMLRAIETRLRARQRSEAVRLEASAAMDASLVNMLAAEEEIKRSRAEDPQEYDEVYSIDGPLDLTSMFELNSLLERPDLRDPPFTPRQIVQPNADMFARISKGDLLLHHPFDSFQPVVRFIEQAARDPNVLAIKQTLYRTSGDSPIISALIEAAEAGKHVTAVVELKARFDEAANISWARRMERAGVHVVFGFMDLKTHSKLALVVRHEGGKKVRQYAHLGTGNYNPTTARLYTDIGLFTADKAITEDVAALFNFLTGYSQRGEWQKLVAAPQDLHRRTIELINEQTQRAKASKKARIFGKFNSLVDRETITALYHASQAGVQVDLVIRGICCLKPGEPGVSDNIRVRSIVDRFLEHSRIMVFGEGSGAQIFCSSADWMPRNFTRRVEVMFPIEDPELQKRILEEIIPTYLRDNTRARELRADGGFVHVQPGKGEEPHRSQQELLALAGGLPLPVPQLDAAKPSRNGAAARREKKPESRKRPASKPSGGRSPSTKRRSKSE
ncbi:Polyphosphate kinase [Posidoniimonas corsicana]|uniref:Polyphosphate kinase n=1 Tax=Posidoniimonas corsicana TaxID=1938618 RepID=A0A5C5VHR9_9BACT|nr:polyphosphate kinase 1 [Posidoniimonas corsicana]TWT38126.1 Polyphosphate kinase [Posidoniimonas corsicana]